MPLADYTAMKAKMASPTQWLEVAKSIAINANTQGACGMGSSLWKGTGYPATGATPTSAAVCDRTTAGAIPIVNASSGENRAWLSRGGAYTQNAVSGVPMFHVQLIDRLIHSGGLDATVATTQTVTTPALTRSTTGAGVVLALQIYTAIGATATTITASYTNQAGTAAQTTQPVVWGSAIGGQVSANRVIPLSFAAGDTGCRACASVVQAATTGTAGNYGVLMYKPLSPILPMFSTPNGGVGDPLTVLGGYLPLVDADACLDIMVYSGQSNVSMLISLVGSMLED